MKAFEILSGKAMIVELPEGAPTPDVINTGQPHLSWLDIDINLPDIDLPPGTWQIVGMLSEVREDQSAGIVDDASFKYPNLFRRKFEDYKCESENDYDTALESLESAILAEGYTFTNSLGNEKEYKKKYKGHPMFFANHMAKWFEAQSRVLSRERCLLLRREDG